MALKLVVGDKFPSITLVDERGAQVSIEEVAGGRPLVLVFYRGHW
jgi:peroxiredoxin